LPTNIDGVVDDRPILANISGVIWGLMREGARVKKGQKLGDIDPRGEPRGCFEITPQARTIAAGVLKGIVEFFYLVTFDLS
jgi:xanthine dehydrogenase accessory factor